MNFLYFILLGALAGWLSGKLVRGRGFGLMGNILVGIVGAVLGGWIFTQLNVDPGNYLMAYQLASAVVGSVVLLLVIGLIQKK
ncbi:MAG: GlsB/YeaQ/YmgE family stress response membrane protein [Chitinophagales bacterium]